MHGGHASLPAPVTGSMTQRSSIRWAVADPAGRHVAYRTTSGGLVARRIASGEERAIDLGAMQVFPTTISEGRLVIFTSDPTTGTQEYHLLDVERCEAHPLSVKVSTSDAAIGYSKISAASLLGSRAFFAVYRGALFDAETRLVALSTLEMTRISPGVHRIFEARADAGRVVWLHERTGEATPGIGEWDLSRGELWTVDLPANARPTQLALSGTRAVWTDLRNAVWTPDSDIYLLDLVTHEIRQITTDPSTQGQPTILDHLVAWSDDRGGNRDVRLLDLDTGEERVVAGTAADEGAPALTAAGIFWTVPGPAGTDLYFDASVRP